MGFLREYRQGFSLAKALLFFIIPWILKSPCRTVSIAEKFHFKIYHAYYKYYRFCAFNSIAGILSNRMITNSKRTEYYGFESNRTTNQNSP